MSANCDSTIWPRYGPSTLRDVRTSGGSLRPAGGRAPLEAVVRPWLWAHLPWNSAGFWTSPELLKTLTVLSLTGTENGQNNKGCLWSDFWLHICFSHFWFEINAVLLSLTMFDHLQQQNDFFFYMSISV